VNFYIYNEYGLMLINSKIKIKYNKE